MPQGEWIMRWTIENIQADNYVRITTEGVFTNEESLQMIDDITSRKFWYAGKNVLFDHRKLKFESTSLDIIKQASQNHQENEARIGDGKTAFVMDSLINFTRGRQYELLTADKVSAKMRVFRSEEEAVRWLVE